MTDNQLRHVRTVLFILILLGGLLFAAGAIRAQILAKSGEMIETNDILDEAAFFAAGDLTISAKSTDDIFAAGGDITIRDARADHMIVGGGDIVVSGAEFSDLLAAGGDIDLVRGEIADDLVIAGGDINVQPEFRTSGSAIIAGGSLSVDGPIGGELRATGASIRLNNTVGGDAQLTGEKIVIGAGARVGGDLRYSAREFELDPAAIISGEIVKVESREAANVEEWGVKAAAAIAGFALAFLIGMGLLIVVIALALPALMNSSNDMIRAKPFSALGIGFLVALAAPAVIGLLFVSILGIPLGIVIALTMAGTAPLALAAFAYFIGMTARSAAVKSAVDHPSRSARAGWSLLAAIILIVIGLIPFIGGVIWIVAFMIGLGAVLTRGGKALALRA